MNPVDRRQFLRLGMATAAWLGVSACTGRQRSTPAGVADGDVPARPTLRLPGDDGGFPSPFAYSPPGFGNVTLIYDSLLWASPTGELVPWLAESHERSPDGRTYTFQLREGLRWHDGNPLTADDVAFSFAYFKAHRPQLGPLLVRAEHVDTARATSPRTVEVKLERPTVTFERAVAARFPIFPRHVWSGIARPAEAQEPAVLVGSGPYRLQSYSRGQGAYLFVAHDEFFLGRPFVKRLELVPVPNPLNALLAGDVDAAGVGVTQLSPQALRPFRRDPRFGEVQEARLDLPAVLQWNLAKGGPIADVRFRQACALAIDRPELVRRVLAGHGEPGNPGFLPPGHPFHVDVEQHAFDPAAANRLLDDAGYRRPTPQSVRVAPDGRPLRFKLLAIPSLSPVTELVVAMVGEVGVGLEIDPVDLIQGFGALNNRDYECGVIFYGGVSGDPDYMRVIYSSRAQPTFAHVWGYSDREFEDLAERQLVTFDEAERRRMVARMQQIVARDVPSLHLYYPRPLLIYRKGVFDQWEFAGNKQVLVTGTKTGLTVRLAQEGS